MRHHVQMVMEIPRTTFQAKMPIMVGGRPRIIDKGQARQSKNYIVCEMLDHRPPVVLKPPYNIHITFLFKAPKCRRRKFKDKPGLNQPMHVKPDIDNLAKGFIDCMVKASWIEADQQIYKLSLGKFETMGNEQVAISIY